MTNKLTDKAKEYLKEQLAYWPSSQRGGFHTWVKWAITDPGMLHAQGLYDEEDVRELIEALKTLISVFDRENKGRQTTGDPSWIIDARAALAAASPSIHVKKEDNETD